MIPRSVNIVLIVLLVIGAVLMGLSFAAIAAQAAQPAPPTVTPCDLVNTATLSGGGMIEVFRCTPDGGAPYLLDSAGFMLPTE